MIITVKTNGAKIKTLEHNLVSQGKKKSRYWVKDTELNDVLKKIHDETGICEFKVEFDKKKIKKKKLNVNEETINN